MSECTCHKNYTLDTLIPKVGVITDIREETPDVKTFRVNARRAASCSSICRGQCAMLCAPGISEGMFSHHLIADEQRISGVQHQEVRRPDRLSPTALRWATRSQSADLTEIISRWRTKLKGKDLLFIAGGIGLAPLRFCDQLCAGQP